MTAVRHPNGTYTDEYRAALFAGPQALERFYQSTVPSPRLEAEPTRGRPQAPAPAPAAPPSRPPHRPRLLRLRAPISGAVRRAPYQPPPFQLRDSILVVAPRPAHRPPFFQLDGPVPVVDRISPHRPPFFQLDGPVSLVVSRRPQTPLFQLDGPVPEVTRRAPHSPPLFSLRDFVPRLAKRQLRNSGTHLHGFMQAADPLHSVQDVISTWQQHLQVQPNQVLLLPIEICAWLLVHQPLSAWAAVAVWPSALALGTDPDTGLDTLSVQTTGTWGVTAAGQTYFTPDGEVGSSENAVLVVSAGQPALIQ